MNPPAAQPQLVQDDFYRHLFAPFLLPVAAGALLGFSTKHVLRLAREKQLRGFNLAVKIEPEDELEESTPRSMIRIMARTVEMIRRPELFKGVRADKLSLEDALLHRRETFTVWEVTRSFDCSDDHVRRLHEAGLIKGRALSITRERHHFTRASLLEFLTTREL